MKVISGTITNVVPDGGYQSQNGYVYTFQMAIQGPNNSLTGQIGSKSEVYPIPVGQPITVEATDTQYGMRFKKQQNPQYAGQSGKQNRDYDKENHGKCFCNILVAVVSSDGIDTANQQRLTQIADLATACMNSYDYRSSSKPQTTQPNPNYSENPAAPEDDSIPF